LLTLEIIQERLPAWGGLLIAGYGIPKLVFIHSR